MSWRDKLRNRTAAIALLAACGVTTPLVGQYAPPSTGGAVTLDYLLQRLHESRRVLMIGAHPDDEDTGLLALLARGRGAAVAYLSLSRGEGGQNLIGDELGVRLGLLRTRELEEARRTDGGLQFFSRAYDFGYSRSLEETAAYWLRDSVLKDVVRIVRRFRPHVIVSVWSGTPRDRHGQHTMSGVTARRAYEVAADSTVFPELGREEGLRPWRPLKFFRSTRFDTAGTTLTLQTGELDPRSGRSFHQIAMASRSRHSSQNMGALQEIGPQRTRLRLISDETGAGDLGLLDGIPVDSGWLSLFADSLRGELSPARLGEGEAVAPLVAALTRARGEAEELDRVRLLEQAVAVAAGLVMDATVAQEVAVPGERIEVLVRLYDGGSEPITVTGFGLEGLGGIVHLDTSVTLGPGEATEARIGFTIPDDAEPTQPYFLERPLVGALYDWSSAPPAVRGAPFQPGILEARLAVLVAGRRVGLAKEVTYRFRDQATGEVRLPFRVVPAIEVGLEPETLVWPVGRQDAMTFTVLLVSNVEGTIAGCVSLQAEGWAMPEPETFTLERRGEQRRVEFRVRAPSGIDRGQISIRAVAQIGDDVFYDRRLVVVDYPHVDRVAWARTARADVRLAPIALPQVGRVGYVRGASDRVPEALVSVGLPVELLDGDDLARRDLSDFAVIVIGSRAYESDHSLAQHNGRLLEYTWRGGHLVVQYQQYQFVRGEYAPYTLSISRPHDRITDEAAAVRMLVPEHPVFTMPNRLTKSDWDGWPQERGLYFAGTWDDRYTPLLEMADPGMQPVRGGLLLADYGDGTYVYTGISFFRALPAGVPGAFRLFLNILALGRRG